LALADPRPMSLKEKQRMTQFILRPPKMRRRVLWSSQLPFSLKVLIAENN
jgi:hypothetical protein